MGLISNLKNFSVVNKSRYKVIENSEFSEVEKALEDLKTISNYSRPEDLSGLTPYITLADYTSMISPLDLRQMAKFSDILRNILPTIRNEIFRNGFDIQADESDIHTDQEDKIYAIIDRANHNEQTLKEVLMELEDDLQEQDNAFLLAVKNYFINDYNDIIGGEIDELLRIDPLLCQKVLDRKARLGYDMDGRQMYFSLSDRTKILYTKRDSKGMQCLRACFKVKTGDTEGDIAYFDTNEILHLSKYNPSKTYGFSQLYSLYNKVMTLINQDTYIRNYYSGAKVPKGILVANTRNSISFQTMWNQFLEKVKKNPHTINPIINQTDDPSKNTMQFISFMNNLQEMQYTEGRNEIRQQIGSLFNVSPIFQNDTSQGGGLNNEGLQITVTNRGVELGQSIHNEKTLPWIFQKNMGITDYIIKLKPSDEIDEVAEKDIRLKELMIAKATAELGITVTMEKDGSFTYDSGTVKLQQTQEPFIPFGNSEKAEVIKGKVSLKPGQDPPEGAKVITGPRGGRYYESSGKESESEKPKESFQDKYKEINRLEQIKPWEEGYKDVREKREKAMIELINSKEALNKEPKYTINFREKYQIENGKGKVINMTPKEYLSKIGGSVNIVSPHSIKSIIDGYKEGEEIPAGLLEIKDNKVIDHDGRHRAIAANILNLKTIPVVLIDKEKQFNLDSIESQFKDEEEQSRKEGIKLVNDVIKAAKLPAKEQKRFQTALEKELNDIVLKLDFSQKPSKTELDAIIEKVTKNLNKRLNAKSANFIKAIYDKAKTSVEKEIDMKFDMTDRDRNVIEALKRDPTYRKAFDGLSLSMSKNLTDIVKQAYDDPKNFTIDKIVDKMKTELNGATDNLRKIARTETSKVSIAARKVQYDKSPFEYLYSIIGPDDNRTGKDSKEIVELTKNGVSWDEMVDIIQKVADKYSKGKWKVDKNAPIPRPNWRHVPIGKRIDK